MAATATAELSGDPEPITEETNGDNNSMGAKNRTNSVDPCQLIYNAVNNKNIHNNNNNNNDKENSKKVQKNASEKIDATVEPSSSNSVPSTPPANRKSPRDFVFIRSIGEGSFSTVYHAKEVTTGNEFAIKVCMKAQIQRENKVHLVHREKEVMARLSKDRGHPSFVRLYCTFQDSERLYFAMTYAKRGEMLDFLRKLGSFDDQVTQFYAAEIVSALDYLHRLGVIHRDLKPENVLLAENMHILISDFGSAKIIGQEDGPSAMHSMKLTEAKSKERSSFVGTAQYVSPEVLNGKPVGPACDYWALGAIIYQMLSGLPPFRAANEYLVFQKIIKTQYSFPQGFPPVAKDLVEHLIVLNAAERLGCEELGGVESLKRHSFFQSVDWTTLHETDPPALKPYLPASGDEPAFHSNYHVPENLEPGLDDTVMTRLLGLEMMSGFTRQDIVEQVEKAANEESERKRLLLEEQRKTNPYHRFVDNHLILKSGLVDKKKGLFARRRMFLLTEGPHLYYVDVGNMELKGEVPWCPQLRAEAKNFRTFFVHTPNRTYYLFDPSRTAVEWCEAIEKVREMYFCNTNDDEQQCGKIQCEKMRPALARKSGSK